MQFFLLAALALAVAPVQPDIPNKQPQVFASSRSVDVVFGSGNTIWMTRSADRGKTFSPPLQLSKGPALMVGRHRGPRVVISGDTVVVSAIYGNTEPGSPHVSGTPGNGDLATWTSSDNGVTWSKPTAVNDVPGSAREGLHAMAANENGEVAAVWLDLRAKGTRLYGAYSRDRGASWSKNVLLYQSSEDTICQCCHPSLVSAGHGRYSVMFRNVVNGSRDMYRLDWDTERGPSQAQKIGVGSWMIKACPMDGGGLASRGTQIASAWRRAETVYLTNGSGPEQAIGQGKNVAVTMTRKGPYVAWTGENGIQLKRPDSDKPITVAQSGDFPTLTTVSDDQVALGWEENGVIKLEILQ